jgi:hypothetical protein
MAAYRHWRLSIDQWATAGTPGTSGDTRVAELAFYTSASVKWPTSAMTSNTAPSPFVASASSVGLGSAAECFNNLLDDSHRWISGTGGGAQWVQIDMGSAQSFTSFTLAPDGAVSSGYYPTQIRILASNTGSFAGEEVEIFAQSGLTTGWTNSTARFFSLAFIDGTVLDDTGSPAARTVRSYDRSTGALIAETTSNATTGVYRIGGSPTGETQVVVLDDSGGTVHEDLIRRVTAA